MRKTFTVLLLLHCCSAVFGQGDFGKVTPQVADFMRYGETPAPLFNGAMSLEVPLYHYSDNDFDIPIKLVYSAEGFKPEKRADFVGLDWSLIAGGCITREVYGVPDENIAYGDGDTDGYYRVVRTGSYQKNKVWNFDPSVMQFYDYYLLKYAYMGFADYEPDLFMFTFNGHSGRFIIDDDAKAKSFNRAYKIDITELCDQKGNELTVPSPSKIKITDTNGYVYEFGGDLSKLEFSIHFTDGSLMNHANTRYAILAWHLSKITAPNGRTVTFNYTETTDAICSHTNSPLWQSGKAEYAVNSMHGSGAAIKKVVLESIVIDNTKIEFKKSVEKTLEQYNDHFFNHNYFNHAVYQLDEISVKQNNTQLFHYNLKYDNRYKRRFLTSIELPDGTYSFDYNHTNYPDPYQPNSENIDVYDFWKNNNTQSSYGLMKKIIYPTGGYSLFAYEKHEFSSALEINLSSISKYMVTASNVSYDTVVNNNGTGIIIPPYGQESEGGYLPPLPPPTTTVTAKYVHNGARIQKISNYSSAGVLATEKEYIYKKVITADGSSGILYLSKPYFRLQYNNAKVYITGNRWKHNYNIDEPAIGYSIVFERHRDGSYSKYQFYNYTDYQDYQDNDNKIHYVYNQPISSDVGIDLIFHIMNRLVSNSDKIGHIKHKTDYTSNNSLKSTKRYEYKWMSSNSIRQTDVPTQEDNNAVDSCNYIVTFVSLPILHGGVAKKIYLDKYHPITKIQSTIDNVMTEEIRKYNGRDLPASISTTDSEGGKATTTFKYPFDFTESPYSEMTEKNILSPVIEQSEKRNSQLIQKKITDYKNWGNNLFAPEYVKQQVGNNDAETRLTYHNYDIYGNPLYLTKYDETRVVYLWGYKGQYRIAEITGVSYDTVKTALGNYSDVQINALSAQENPDVATISSTLRTQLPSAQITTFKYKPLVGVLTITSPQGIAIYYNYDGSGRLRETYYYESGDSSTPAIKKKVEGYDYHYR